MAKVRKRHTMHDFNSREEWAAYAIKVATSNGGRVYLNLYAWVRGKVLARAVGHAVGLGLMRRAGGPPQQAVYELTNGGRK